ncbi:hypothetical protein PBY51_024939 [Eleginops maclovinus]|uniref:Uncharacterized protein n=1 Tax=Eleginops maclovinus TaxID=56733 RepID=A0AAN7Y2G6_ELEMC|nr:hypothetical protein PBY51_024939 [Eleginops maclovinus]
MAAAECLRGCMPLKEDQKVSARRESDRQEDLQQQRELKTDGGAPTCTLHAHCDLLHSAPALFSLRLILFAIPFHVAQGTNKSEEGLPADTDSYLFPSPFCPSGPSISLSQPWLADRALCLSSAV